MVRVKDLNEEERELTEEEIAMLNEGAPVHVTGPEGDDEDFNPYLEDEDDE
jgi:hypothetical protein